MNKSQAARLEWKLDGIVENQLASVANNQSRGEMFGRTPWKRHLPVRLALEDVAPLLRNCQTGLSGRHHSRTSHMYVVTHVTFLDSFHEVNLIYSERNKMT